MTISYGFDCSTVGVYNIPTSHTVTYPPQQLIDKTVNNLRFDATIQAVSNSTVLTSVSSPEYLNRSEGHTIIALENSTSSSPTSGFMFNQIIIAFPSKINKLLGTTSQTTKFGLSSTVNATTGTLINLNLQIKMFTRL